MPRLVFILSLFLGTIVSEGCTFQSKPPIIAKTTLEGQARMATNGHLILTLISTNSDGSYGQSQVSYQPRDPEYNIVLARVGGLKPGEAKPFNEWVN